MKLFGSTLNIRRHSSPVAIAAVVLLSLPMLASPALALSDNDVTAATTATGSASALSARFAALKSELGSNQFQRPLYLNSIETGDVLSGEIFAIVNHPFASASAALGQASQWCEVMILHLNTKYCKETEESSGPQLRVAIGKKFDQPIDKAYRVDFAYRLVARTDSYLQVKLNADEGPLSTRNYRIVLEATPGPTPQQTYIRMSYSYSYGTMAQIAMRAYLSTIGRNKIGFTMVRDTPDAKPQPIGGMRGVVERNTMRYYLAIEAFLGALSAPPAQRAEKGFRDWYAATESYPRQLHEMEQAEYLDMKRKEYQRQQQGQS